jgi:hypothetical protein
MHEKIAQVLWRTWGATKRADHTNAQELSERPELRMTNLVDPITRAVDQDGSDD